MAILTASVTLALAMGLSAMIGEEQRIQRLETRCFNAEILHTLHEIYDLPHGNEVNVLARPECQSILAGGT